MSVKSLILILFSVLCFAEVDTLYRGQTKSLVDWQGLDAQDWLNLDSWKEATAFKSKVKYWEALQRIQKLKEPVGRVLSCRGECRLFRDAGEHQVQYMSEVMEADEILTYKDSYLWVFLYDGTLVRLSPESSMTVKEINISDEKVFLHARLNLGNILWLSRSQKDIQPQKLRETDAIFFPLEIYEANPLTRDGNITVTQYLFGDQDVVTDQYLRVNDFVKKNNKIIDKKTESLLVLPNATIFGEGISLEAYVSIAGDNYFKLRTEEELFLEEPEAITAQVNLRGYANTSKETIEAGSWYRVSMPARDLVLHDPNPHMNINELITRRIPSIYYAREFMFNKYSSEIFDKKITPEVLAMDHGYRKWSSKENEMRLEFLWNFSRKLETSNLAVASRYRQGILKKHSLKDKEVVRVDFFDKALSKYLEHGEVDREKFYNPKRNSEKKKFWKRINGIRSKAYSRTGLGESEKKGTSGMDESPDEGSTF